MVPWVPASALLVLLAVAFDPSFALRIAPTSPNLQYIGRFGSDGTGNKTFDLAGSEIRASLSLEVSSKLYVSLAQRHLPPPAAQASARQRRC